MKFSQYIFNNLTQKKIRTLLCVIGIATSLVSSTVMALLTDYYSSRTSTFFQPFPEFDEVLERGTNFIQFIPVGSTIDLDVKSELDLYFNIDSIPLLIVPNNEDLLSLYNNYIYGVPFLQQQSLFHKIYLQMGRWPQNSNEIVVGNEYLDKRELTLFNHTFPVVGVISKQYSYLDRIIIMDHTILEQKTGNYGKTTVIFIPSSLEKNISKINKFEMDNSHIDVLTSSEIEALHGQIGDFMDNLVNVLSVFTAGASIIFVFSLELMNIFSRKKDFDIFRILGAKTNTIFQTVIIENLILLISGLIVGIPVSILSFSLLYSYIVLKVNHNATFFKGFAKGWNFIFHPFQWDLFIENILLICIANISFALIISLIGLRQYKLSELKQKY
ncbi:FtsX-like permease family protein [Candidatus Harpocratesius sp.]